MAEPRRTSVSDSSGEGPSPFARRASISTTTRIYPVKSVLIPQGHGPSSSSSSSSAPPSPSLIEHDDSESTGGRTQRRAVITRHDTNNTTTTTTTQDSSFKPPSLTPYLDKPTTHQLVDEPAGPTRTKTSTASGELAFAFTTRFEHVVGDDGQHLVVTGRDGQFVRCEDEPIRTPQAVQAFGVLIAFDQQPDSDSLIVQQVSENSGFVLGLPPTSLFKTKGFERFLSQSELEVLLDAIEMLDERDSDPDDEEVGPVYFELNGHGLPGSDPSQSNQSEQRLEWSAHCALHRPDIQNQPRRLILELELMDDQVNPLTTQDANTISFDERDGMDYQGNVNPTQEDLAASTVSMVKPLRALTRSRNRRTQSKRSNADTDVVGLLSQINDQLGKATDLATFLKLVSSIFAELTQFTRCMVYQFDENWNGRVVAEQVDYTRTKDLYRGLNFPATDIPAQARELYRINKVRLLYDRDQPTARMCCRSKQEVDNPLDMTHCLLRAMSPIHIKYLANMGVRSSMSVSVTAFGGLWGLIAMHTYGKYGQRVSFPLRQLAKLLGDSISRNIERLSYAQRLNARKLINTEPTEANPTGFIVAKSEDLLTLFDADFGVLSIGDEAKIMGNVHNSQEVLALIEYLRVKPFTRLEATQDIRKDWKELEFTATFETVAGALVIPLSTEGKDFIVFFRKGQEQEVRWAGNPYSKAEDLKPLEPRKSFKTWSETIVGRCRAWKDEELETASSVQVVYGKFIAVWREKRSAQAVNQLNQILLSNASHEVRTPLNAIVNYLELALDSEIPPDVRDSISRSHAASKSLIHVINDLLDLTRAEQGQTLFLQEPFNFPETLYEALEVHKNEAIRQGISLEVIESPTGTPPVVLGDRAKIRIIVLRIVENALKHTEQGGILVEWGETSIGADSSEGNQQKRADEIRLSISITDTGSGISEEKLETIFREFEQVSTTDETAEKEQGSVVGLGLAVVARIVRTLGGQLRVESKLGQGSKFTIILPFRLPSADDLASNFSGPRSIISTSSASSSSTKSVRQSTQRSISSLGRRSKASGSNSGESEIDSLIAEMSSTLHPAANSAPRSNTSSHGSSKRSAASKSMSSKSAGANSSNLKTGRVGGSDGIVNSPTVSRSVGSKSSVKSGGGGGGAAGTVGTSIMSGDRRGSLHVQDSAYPLKAVKVTSFAEDSKQEDAGAATPRASGSQHRHRRSSQAQSSPNPNDSLDGSGQKQNPSTSASAPINQDVEVRDFEHEPAQEKVRQRSNSLYKDSTSSNRSSRASTSSKQNQQQPISISSDEERPPSPDGERDDWAMFPLRVLVVEDDRINRMILQQRLKIDGHKVTLAEHGREAVRIMEERFGEFDLVLMDLLMPIMGGLDATSAIRKLEDKYLTDNGKSLPATTRFNGRLPVLAVTASLPEREKQTIIDAGLDGWLLKPLDIRRLRCLLKGTVDAKFREANLYQPGNWERGGFLFDPTNKDHD
ncbi:hypothetical protein OIO90_006453 [Microbotryomycetes sp. JL221]|nr:hypothetical protein OIO90_006453 [Microbotryomycetes sp. JL221]